MPTSVAVTASVTSVIPAVYSTLVGEVDSVASFPWSRAALTAAQIATAAADVPMLVSGNVAGDGIQDPEWRSGGLWTTGLDETVTDAGLRQRTTRVFDGLATVTTRGGSSVDNALLFELDSVAFDVAALWVPNLVTIDPDAVRLEIADDEAFSSNLEVLAEWTSDYGRRLVEVQLGGGDGYRYSDVRYLRVVFDNGAALPIRVAEVYLGTRYSPDHAPEIEEDEDATESRWLEAEADDGDTQRVPLWTRRLNTTLRWRPDTTAYVDLFRDWHAGTRWGADPALYIPTPASDPRICYLVMPPTDLAIENQGAMAHEVAIGLREQAPYVAKENV